MIDFNSIRIRKKTFLRVISLIIILDLAISLLALVIFLDRPSFYVQLNPGIFLFIGLYLYVRTTRRLFANIPLKSFSGLFFLVLVFIQIPSYVWGLSYLLYHYALIQLKKQFTCGVLFQLCIFYRSLLRNMSDICYTALLLNSQE